jgi:hypothetical protein
VLLFRLKLFDPTSSSCLCWQLRLAVWRATFGRTQAQRSMSNHSSLDLLPMTPPPTIGNCNGIPTVALLHSGILTTPLAGPVASAVCKSHATLRPTALRLIAVTSPTPARARIPATLRLASRFQRLLRLLQYLVCRRLARGIPTIQPVGRLVCVSIPYPCHHTAVGLCTQRSLNAASWRMLARRTTSALQTWWTHPQPSPQYHPHPSQLHLPRQAVLPRLPQWAVLQRLRPR